MAAKTGGKGKGRKAGDWKAIAAGRARIPRELINGRGLTNIPRIDEVGSAAYRRLVNGTRHAH